MPLTSAHKILTTINILDPEQKDGEQKRHPKNEFQAYAVRLAHDLNDLQNIQIYMRLAKNVERSLMEKAYSFVADSSSNQKGRLFLWKLKQIRTDIQKRRDSTNFDYKFVTSKMAKTRDKLAEVISEKAENDYSPKQKKALEQAYSEIQLKSDSKKTKQRLLIIGYSPLQMLADSEQLGFRVQGIEISKKLSAKIKKGIKELNLKTNWIAKDFLKNSFESKSFDVILLNSYWSLIPRDSEITFLKAIKKILKKNGKLVVNSKVSKAESQEWKILKNKGEDLECFVKECSQKNLEENFGKLFENVDFLN